MNDNLDAGRVERDWTCDVDGRSNSSEFFVTLCKEVERLIRGDAHQLIGGRADMTARLIMAQLAHVHGLLPPRVDARALDPSGEPSDA